MTSVSRKPLSIALEEIEVGKIIKADPPAPVAEVAAESDAAVEATDATPDAG